MAPKDGKVYAQLRPEQDHLDSRAELMAKATGGGSACLKMYPSGAVRDKRASPDESPSSTTERSVAARAKRTRRLFFWLLKGALFPHVTHETMPAMLELCNSHAHKLPEALT